MRVVIACAGSGGHINPGIAIANYIKQKEPSSDILFIGTKKGLENELVKKAGYDITCVRAGKLNREFSISNIKNMINAGLGILDSQKVLKEFKPDIVIGTGGYICVPVMKAASFLKIPYVLHESNVYPGLSVKLNAKGAKKILLGFEETKKYLPKANCIYTGTPAKFTSADIDALSKKDCKKELNLSDKKILFVTGGSQGAKKINETVIAMVKKYMPKDFFIVLAVGHSNYEKIYEKIGNTLDEYLRLEKFVYEMDKMYKASDMLLTRAGAMTVLELEIAAKPAILVPLPSAAENHQLYNAKVLEKNKAGIVIEEKKLNEDILYENITKYITNTKALNEMGNNARSLLQESVEEKIYNEIKNIL